MNFRQMNSYLACLNQSCLDIIEVYKKMQLLYDNCVLSVGQPGVGQPCGSVSRAGVCKTRSETRIKVVPTGGPDKNSRVIC